MFSFKSVLFFTCIAFVAAFPTFFRFAQPNREGEGEAEMPLKGEPYEMNQVAPQVASPSYDYGGGDAGAGTDTTASEESAEDDTDGEAGPLGGDAAENDAADNEAAETEAAENAAGDSPDAVEAGGASGAASPNHLGGGPGLVSKGDTSVTGRNVGIAFGVITAVGLAAGCGYYVYRKRRAAAYGARF